LTYLVVGSLQVLLLLGGIVAQLVGVMLTSQSSADRLNNNPALQIFDPNSINFTMIGLGLWIPALFGLIVLLPRVRRAIAKLLPIDPDSIVHAVALSFATLILPNLFVTLGIGLENLTQSLSETTDTTDLLLTTWAQNFGLFVLGMVGVGWLTRRTLSGVAKRLKLQMVSPQEVLIGAGAGIALLIVLAAILAIADALGLGDPSVDALSEELYGPFFKSIFGILTVGIAAAWGEETVFRGALQPKFGRLFTSFLFAITHGNYGLSVTTVGIFLVGYALGFIRDRYSTTTSMITHATFNCIQALLAYLALQYGIGI
jgi:membrane protease YdiL (CAAX protease family)